MKNINGPRFALLLLYTLCLFTGQLLSTNELLKNKLIELQHVLKELKHELDQESFHSRDKNIQDRWILEQKGTEVPTLIDEEKPLLIYEKKRRPAERERVKHRNLEYKEFDTIEKQIIRNSVRDEEWLQERRKLIDELKQISAENDRLQERLISQKKRREEQAEEEKVSLDKLKAKEVLNESELLQHKENQSEHVIEETKSLKLEPKIAYSYEQIEYERDKDFMRKSKDANDFIQQFCSNGYTHPQSGYVFIVCENFKGIRELDRDGSDINIKSFHNKDLEIKNKKAEFKKKEAQLDQEEKELMQEDIDFLEEELNDIQDAVVGQYKIHLMPKTSEDLMIILEKLLEEVKNNNNFAKKIYSIKYKTRIPFLLGTEKLKEDWSNRKGMQNILPFIVIYPATGKTKAQKALNHIYELFKGMEGLDLTPRFNKKITNLIYYGQGDADFKLRGSYDQYYTQDKIFYASGFGNEEINNYELENPALNK